MREVIAICRSRKSASDRVARVLDRYLWRVGDRTWRGKASNTCLDRMARELRARASRATAVSIQEIRSTAESRMPLIRIGSRVAFYAEGFAPIATHASGSNRMTGSATERNGLAVVRIAALFHDLGKATRLFQTMLSAALSGDSAGPTPIRHELYSAAVWDVLFGQVADAALGAALRALTPADVDAACVSASDQLMRNGSPAGQSLAFRFLQNEHCLSFAIGMLILTHHRLPEGETDHLALRGAAHAAPVECLDRRCLDIAPGIPFWQEAWWLRRLSKEAAALSPTAGVVGVDIALRSALVFADHVGSSEKALSDDRPDHLANTCRDKDGRPRPADSLATHVRRVYLACRPAHELLHRLRDRLPALPEAQMPLDLIRPRISDPRFLWQQEAAAATRDLVATSDGGFFACLIAGTGTGKTRGAPTILSAASFADARPERRYFRMTLALGLRNLASQSAREYVEDLALAAEDVRTLIGVPPVDFGGSGAGPDGMAEDPTGSASLAALPEWLRIERAEGAVPAIGDPAEPDWLRGLSLDTDRGLPAILSVLVRISGSRAKAFSALAASPVIVGTVDHLMGVAAPTRSAFLPAALRTMTSDLVLDEVDQYGPEDIAALARLVFQAAAAGRRVILMSATLTPDIAVALHAAYRAGWRQHAAASGTPDHVHLLLTGDAPGSVVTNAQNEPFATLHNLCRDRILDGLAASPAIRRGEVLPPCGSWGELVAQIDQGCSRMHASNAVDVEGVAVSVGLVRLTRIAHVAALFQQLPAGSVRGRLRVKLCLHSNFPRLHRAWVEHRLKAALTRKGNAPEAGLAALCRAEDLFRRAAVLGAREIEIVCVTSPVIETGNDLDFDYAILDPSSLRAIVQAAGRVRRHRRGAWSDINILILGRSPIAMQDGQLVRPGVETAQPEETLVPREDLSRFPGRSFADLAGGLSFSTVDASILLSEAGPAESPLRVAEAALRAKMLALEGEHAPLGRYLARRIARMNTRFTRTRMFRRATSRRLRYSLGGESLSDGIWQVELPNGSGAPILRSPAPGVCLADTPRGAETKGQALGGGETGMVFHSILERAWHALSGGSEPMPTALMRDLVAVEIADYGGGTGPLPDLTYAEQTGFTRGRPEDLFKAFGKR
ncbi:hypothetical protein [Frigidibacter sp. MR17.24]|uniref:hypothetical protein n=1 Tax=Frigidibacter sp. MR17.24 TaxID=3127345 RepID=UPI0030130835